MLRDKNGKWVENLEINEDFWTQLKQETLNGIIRLLYASNNLLINDGNEAISAGLYTFAIEEYGKLLLLKQNAPANGKITLHYKRIFRDTRHENKFPVAIENLEKQAPECIFLQKGLFDPAIFDPHIFDTNAPIIANFQTRIAIFYCDVADSGVDIKQVPPVDKTLLRNAINKLLTIVLGIDVDT